MSVRLYRLILPVEDIEGAADFYAELLGLSGERVSPGRHYFDCGGTILACFDPQREDGYDATPNPEYLYFAVDELEATYRAVQEAGGKLLDVDHPDTGPMGQIAKRPWGELSFYASDPFGNKVCFVERTTAFRGE